MTELEFQSGRAVDFRMLESLWKKVYDFFGNALD